MRRADVYAAALILLCALAFYLGARWGSWLERRAMREYFPGYISELNAR